MDKVMRYISLLIALGFFVLATFLLFSPYFGYLSSEVRVIFAVFLYLYGAFRMVRILMKQRRERDDSE